MSYPHYTSFIRRVRSYYSENPRTMPWRNTDDPYKILVSEVMLQQTQVDRVIPKYELFVKRFPTIASLAAASKADVLSLWSGLGYNRRALWLHETSKEIMKRFNGAVPADPEILAGFKGIGIHTASAVCVYAYNQPLVFIETNIRAVYIHHFFSDTADVSDEDILHHVKATLDRKNPRQWYWALMDYGSYIKKRYKNPARKSKHYGIQPQFKGSRRQLRGAIIRDLLDKRQMSLADVYRLHDELIRNVSDARGTADRRLSQGPAVPSVSRHGDVLRRGSASRCGGAESVESVDVGSGLSRDVSGGKPERDALEGVGSEHGASADVGLKHAASADVRLKRTASATIIDEILSDLEREGFLSRHGDTIKLDE